MNNIKALKILNENLQVAVHDCDGLSPECEQEQQEQVKALQIAVKAVKKQIPKKALDMTFSWAVCPVCGGSIYLNSIKEYMLDGENTHCEHCGQTIDWGDTE